MSVNICNMLYVEDVKIASDFWLAAGFVEIKRQGEGREETIILAPTLDSNARLQLWDIDYIREVSPEVAEMKPSLLFTVDNLEEWHEKISKVAKTITPINEHQGMVNFAFEAYDNAWFAFAESELPNE